MQEVDIWFQSPYLDKVEMKVFVGETLSCGMLDSGCTQIVCGMNWLSCFKDSLGKSELDSTVEKSSNTTFTSGDRKSVSSLKKVILPTVIQSKKANLERDAVDVAIPLLYLKQL